MYYSDKLKTIKRIFNANHVYLDEKTIKVDNVVYPIVDDVIILINNDHCTNYVKSKIGYTKNQKPNTNTVFSEKTQYTFSEEWKSYSDIKPEHKKEFELYFDLVDINSLRESTICDLGCGIGRWSYFLKDICKEIILIDFSDAIFEARKNLFKSKNCIFLMADIQKLPFKSDFADLIFSLGVLHHLPTNCIQEVRKLQKYAPTILIYLYYNLDNRPIYFKFFLFFITIIRMMSCKIKNILIRKIITKSICLFIYRPMIILGAFFNIFQLGTFVPLFEAYHRHSTKRIEQDVYDRFFTPIEQRVTRKQIYRLSDTYSKIIISEKLPFWHFMCKR